LRRRYLEPLPTAHGGEHEFNERHSECGYHDDDFDDNPVIGWNFYMMPELATRGLLLINQFYNSDGTKKHNEDLELPYPDLSKFKIWK
jgi:hypothetical protein